MKKFIDDKGRERIHVSDPGEIWALLGEAARQSGRVKATLALAKAELVTLIGGAPQGKFSLVPEFIPPRDLTRLQNCLNVLEAVRDREQSIKLEAESIASRNQKKVAGRQPRLRGIAARCFPIVRELIRNQKSVNYDVLKNALAITEPKQKRNLSKFLSSKHITENPKAWLDQYPKEKSD